MTTTVATPNQLTGSFTPACTAETTMSSTLTPLDPTVAVSAVVTAPCREAKREVRVRGSDAGHSGHGECAGQGGLARERNAGSGEQRSAVRTHCKVEHGQVEAKGHAAANGDDDEADGSRVRVRQVRGALLALVEARPGDQHQYEGDAAVVNQYDSRLELRLVGHGAHTSAKDHHEDALDRSRHHANNAHDHAHDAARAPLA